MPHLDFLHAHLTLCIHAFKHIISLTEGATSFYPRVCLSPPPPTDKLPNLDIYSDAVSAEAAAADMLLKQLARHLPARVKAMMRLPHLPPHSSAPHSFCSSLSPRRPVDSASRRSLAVMACFFFCKAAAGAPAAFCSSSKSFFIDASSCCFLISSA